MIDKIRFLLLVLFRGRLTVFISEGSREAPYIHRGRSRQFPIKMALRIDHSGIIFDGAANTLEPAHYLSSTLEYLSVAVLPWCNTKYYTDVST